MDVVLRVTAFGDLTGEEQSTEVQSYFTRGECAGAAETGPPAGEAGAYRARPAHPLEDPRHRASHPGRAHRPSRPP